MRKIWIIVIMAGLICLGPLIIKTLTHKTPQVQRAAYSWQSSAYLDPENIQRLTKQKFTTLYVKIMDIGWNPVYKAYPMTATRISSHIENSIHVIPVIFITNETMKKCSEQDIDELSKKLILKTTLLVDSFKKTDELQIDCDWTPSTKNNYFRLLTNLKKALKSKTLSVTIRLHQYKYKGKTGVPPADRGMLMLYNMGHINRYDEPNSIFNERETWKYIDGSGTYDLPLDIALPSFNWAIVFENKQFSRIMHHFTKQMADTCSFLTKKPNGNYIMKGNYWYDGDNYLQYGDEIRIEDINEKNLINAAIMGNKIANTDTFRVSFFEINSSTFNQLDSTVYENIFNRFK